MEVRRIEENSMRIKVASVTVARNEERYLPLMIASLHEQTLRPEVMVIVNDGSTDKTEQIAKLSGSIVLDLPHHKESFAGKPELAKVLNSGLEHIGKLGAFDYVLKIDADHILPPNYVEEIVVRMMRNPKVVVASGVIEGEPYEETTPRGSGRVVDYRFWKKTNELQYPVTWGWESWLYLKAMELGYETRCFRDIVSRVQRPTSLVKAGTWGKAMYALGYDWKYALGRCLITFVRSPRGGWSMFWNWLSHKDVRQLDIAEWVNKRQKKVFWKRVMQVLKGT